MQSKQHKIEKMSPHQDNYFNTHEGGENFL
jgi:hypothetical protein